ncbi:MAG TPA: SH3 domain-containing protein [Thermoanaerobaculia bacterium]|nr:SH3 domain-containing protein [Thermoanaerobaculia bacterium]
MRPFLVLLVLLILCSCATTPAPAPSAPPGTPAPPPATPQETVTGTVYVTASALNVRNEPSMEAEVIASAKQGTALGVVRSDASWTRVRLADGTVGWVSSRYVADERVAASRREQTKRGGCPPDSDYAFLEAPTPGFSEFGAHGLVVVEATVNARGIVTGTKLISNGTGDPALAEIAEREIRSSKFSPPIQDCQPRAFFFTYRRTF